MPYRFEIKADTAANWTANDPTLLAAEPGYESDTGKIKIGDGSTAWTSLAYWVVPHVHVAADVSAAGSSGDLQINDSGAFAGRTPGLGLAVSGSAVGIGNGSTLLTDPGRDLLLGWNDTANELQFYLNQSRLRFSAGVILSANRGTAVFEGYTDFLSPNSYEFDGLTRATGGTGASVAAVSASASLGANRIGLVSFSTGSTTTGRAGMSTSSVQLLSNGTVRLACSFRVPTLSDASNTFTIALQLAESSTSPSANNRVGFRYSHGLNSGKWLAECDSAGSTSTLDSGVTVAVDTWYELELVVNGGGTSVEFFVNGSSVGTIATNIPTATALGILHGIFKSAGTTARLVYADWLYERFERTSAL